MPLAPAGCHFAFIWRRDPFVRRGRFAALRKGCADAKAELQQYPRADLPALETLLRSAQGKYEKVLIAADALCPEDATLCPLEELVRLKMKYKCWLSFWMVSHTDGALGATGAGP